MTMPKKTIFNLDVWLPKTEESFHVHCKRTLWFTPTVGITVSFEDLYVQVSDIWYNIKEDRLYVYLADDDSIREAGEGIAEPCMKLDDWTLNEAVRYFKRCGFKVSGIKRNGPDKKTKEGRKR
jgi:hypothetical protein